MEVIVKNIQISKTHISKMAYNHINNILACNIDGNDTILFFALDSQSMTFVQLFKGMSKPPGSKISMSWSPDGHYLALAAGNIEIWQFKDGRLKPLKTFHEDFIEIKIIQWSVDSQMYACGGISKTNTIKIRNIETGKMKQLQLPQRQTISAISFDPYGKYLFLLLRNNTIEIYSVLNYEKYKSVKLSPEGFKINPIKEIRVPSWSPDFSNFVCPSLDDSRINLAINLSRTKDFKSKNIFMGHCTSISCCKFNPKLYKWNGQITSIVAMGDSAGNVSFWRIGKKTDFPQPLLLSNSMQNSMQVVEDLEWDEKGQILMVNMMKKYVHMIKFLDKPKTFGIELSNDEVFALIRQTYGANRATDVNKREIEVFDLNSVSAWEEIDEQKKVNVPQNIVEQNHQPFNSITEGKDSSKDNEMEIEEEIIKDIVLEQKPKITVEIPSQQMQLFPRNSLTMASALISESKNEYVKLSEQKVIIGKNNKKKIQPAIMVRKEQIGFIQPMINQRPMLSNFNNSMNTMYFSNSMIQTFPSLQLPLITFFDKQITLGRNRILEIKKLNKVTALDIIDFLNDREYLVRRIFPSIIDHIHVAEKFIYVINQQFLYIFDLELNPKQLPFKIGLIHKFLANDNGVVYFINCEGYLIGFDHLQNLNKTLTPVPLHLLLKDNFHSQNNPESILIIKEFVLTINYDIFVTIQSDKLNSKNRRQRFLYDSKKNGWSKLELKEGLLEAGFSIRITDSEQNVVKHFFNSLCPSLKDKTSNLHQNIPKQKPSISSGVISPQEQEMIFYSKYQKDKSKFYDCLIEYLNSLKNEHKNKQLRNTVNQYFFDRSSLNYIEKIQQREKVWEKIVKNIGGNIIEEFVINRNSDREKNDIE